MAGSDNRCVECTKKFSKGEITYKTHWYGGWKACGTCKRELESFMDAAFLEWEQETAKGDE